MDKLKQFQQVYDEAVVTINRFLEPGNHEPQINGLVQWMLETDANPYAYLPYAWASSLYTAESFADLLDYIHHAVYDDGGITFVTVNDEPRIVFAHQHEENFRDHVLNDHEKRIEKYLIFGEHPSYDIRVLDIEPNEFGMLYDAFQSEEIKKCFINDAAHNGVEWAVNIYRKYHCWDENWITECREEIKAAKNILSNIESMES